MFPSPQERKIHNAMKSELRSGITPQAFGLERIRYLEFPDQGQSLNLQGVNRCSIALRDFVAKAMKKLIVLLTIPTSRKLPRSEI